MYAHHAAAVEPPELEATVAVLGDPGTGKSTLLRAEVDRALDGSAAPALAGSPLVANRRTKAYALGGRRWHVHFLDVPGSERFRRSAAWHTAGAAAAVYVVSLHSRPSVEHAREWAARTAGARRCGGGFIIANHTQTCAPLVKMAEVQEMAARLGMRAFETSTVNGSGIADAFRTIVEAVAADVPDVPEPGALVHKGVKVCPSLVVAPTFQRQLYSYE